MNRKGCNMKVGHIDQIKAKIYDDDCAKSLAKKILIGPNEGWSGWAMRIMEIKPGGYSPKHAHDWPHINYFLSGQGILMIDNEEHEVRTDSYAFVPANVIHQFKNTSEDSLRFICIVPEHGEGDLKTASR